MDESVKEYSIIEEHTLIYSGKKKKIYLMLIKEDTNFQVLITSKSEQLLSCIFNNELEALKAYSVVYGKLGKFIYYEHAVKCIRICARYKENKEIILAFRFINSFEKIDTVKKLRRRYGYDITLFFSISISHEDEETRMEMSFPGNKSRFGYFAGLTKGNLKFYLYNNYVSKTNI